MAKYCKKCKQTIDEMGEWDKEVHDSHIVNEEFWKDFPRILKNAHDQYMAMPKWERDFYEN